MYIPKFYEENDFKSQVDLIKSNPLGVLFNYVAPGGVMSYITGSNNNSVDSEMCASHIPFVLIEDGNGGYKLIAHLAAENQHVEMLTKNPSCMIVFQGPNSYVSPAWYPLKQKTHKFVPTWDFAVVHVYGKAKVIKDKDWLLDMLNKITNQEENKRPDNCEPEKWEVSETDQKYLDTLLNRIVGLEVEITNMQAKFKLHQDSPPVNVRGVLDGYKKECDEESGRKMTELVLKHYPREL